MRILLISTTIYPIPLKGYGGLEELVTQLALGLAGRGHQVAVVCPETSSLPEGTEIIFTGLREEEELAWQRYRGRLEAGEWEVVVDASWQRWATMSNVGREPQIPIVNWHHTDVSVYGSSAPVIYPLWVGLSKDHAERLARHLKVPVRFVYNGIDLDFYKANDSLPRSNRYLWLARWTPEKAGADIISLAQKIKVPVTMHGDTEIIGSQDYARLCFSRADGLYARVGPGVSREATVELYSTHKALLQLYGWSEPFGLNLVEAMACGCVPIAQRSGAAPELIRDGVTGFLVDTQEEMENLILRDAVREIKPLAMRKHVEKRFSLERFVGAWEKLLSEVVNGARW